VHQRPEASEAARAIRPGWLRMPRRRHLRQGIPLQAVGWPRPGRCTTGAAAASPLLPREPEASDKPRAAAAPHRAVGRCEPGREPHHRASQCLPARRACIHPLVPSPHAAQQPKPQPPRPARSLARARACATKGSHPLPMHRFGSNTALPVEGSSNDAAMVSGADGDAQGLEAAAGPLGSGMQHLHMDGHGWSLSSAEDAGQFAIRWPHPSFKLFCNVAVDAMSPANGSTQLWPGSHRITQSAAHMACDQQPIDPVVMAPLLQQQLADATTRPVRPHPTRWQIYYNIVCMA
jgi:hypothetical protein